MLITLDDIRTIVTECVRNILNEGQTLIDNFDVCEKMLDINSDDDFHFVQIMKRFKDNPNDNKSVGNYHGGTWYIGGFRVHSGTELQALKSKIIKLCNDNNARAYITINSRSEKDTDSFIKIYRKQFRPSDPRYIHADQIVPGQAKDGPNWKGVRKRVLIDIDVPKSAKGPDGKNIWNEVHFILNMMNIQPLHEYETSSGGLHIILPDKEDPKFQYLKKMFEKFDNWTNKGRLATVHPNPDAKMILYSNVKTAGY